MVVAIVVVVGIAVVVIVCSSVVVAFVGISLLETVAELVLLVAGSDVLVVELVGATVVGTVVVDGGSELHPPAAPKRTLIRVKYIHNLKTSILMVWSDSSHFFPFYTSLFAIIIYQYHRVGVLL